ncbi:unnamed protein product [Nezara viridula]|uniref:Uncharacterized protein n=1 Tax=Nezara viridula TaxID=85310 RepID=A0A9P0E6V2_NEZVI|nr:unnamed protein product [Nezara viridula]
MPHVWRWVRVSPRTIRNWRLGNDYTAISLRTGRAIYTSSHTQTRSKKSPSSGVAGCRRASRSRGGAGIRRRNVMVTKPTHPPE